jgi:glycosyl-4,4'-diaponeurosporenoate acyltransferase
VRVVELSDPVTVVVDIVAWGLIHAGTGYAVHRLPVVWLARDRWLFRAREFERGGRFYRRTLRIGRWKDRLPEAGALFAGGVSKRHLPTGDRGLDLERFVVETRRAELGHWLAGLPAPLFVLWNPPVAAVLMVAYGWGVNLPFIAIQRYNRVRAEGAIRRSMTRSPGTRSPGTPSSLPRSSAPPAASRAAARSRNDRGTSGSSMP